MTIINNLKQLNDEEHETYLKFCRQSKYLKSDSDIAHKKRSNSDNVAIKDTVQRNANIPQSIYFGGAAYGCGYYIGVYKGMLEKWGKDFMDHTIITGDSAGIIMVLGITLKYSPEYIGKLYLDTGKLNKHGLLSKNGFKNLEDCCLRNLLENDDALKTLNNRCYIGYSTFFDNHIWKNTWNSIEELLQCCKNSMYIPLFVPSSGMKNIIEGGFCCKGTDLIHGNDTMFVGDDLYADIYMNMKPIQLFYPSKGKDFEYMIDIGYQSFMNWNDSIMKDKVNNRKTKTMIQFILWFMKFIEIFIDLFSYIYTKLLNTFIIWISIVVVFMIIFL